MRLRKVDWLCEVLGIKRPQAYRLLRERIVPSVRLGRNVRVEENAIWRFIEGGGRGNSGPDLRN